MMIQETFQQKLDRELTKLKNQTWKALGLGMNAEVTSTESMSFVSNDPKSGEAIVNVLSNARNGNVALYLYKCPHIEGSPDIKEGKVLFEKGEPVEILGCKVGDNTYTDTLTITHIKLMTNIVEEGKKE